jgi:hypothetical protein
VSHVPLADEIIDTGEESALKQSKEDTRSHETGVVLHETLEDHSQRPEEHDESEPDARSCPLHHHVRRYLCRNIEWEEDGEAIIVLDALEVEVFLEMIETCIADVGAVEEAKPAVN